MMDPLRAVKPAVVIRYDLPLLVEDINDRRALDIPACNPTIADVEEATLWARRRRRYPRRPNRVSHVRPTPYPDAPRVKVLLGLSSLSRPVLFSRHSFDEFQPRDEAR